MENESLSLASYKEVEVLIKNSLSEFKEWTMNVLNINKRENEIKFEVQEGFNRNMSKRFDVLDKDLRLIREELFNIDASMSKQKVRYNFIHDKRTAMWVFIGALIGSSSKEVMMHPKLIKVLVSIAGIFI